MDKKYTMPISLHDISPIMVAPLDRTTENNRLIRFITAKPVYYLELKTVRFKKKKYAKK